MAASADTAAGYRCPRGDKIFGIVSVATLLRAPHMIAPFRGGRVLAVTGVAGDAQTYYFGAAAGGVWKSRDGGAHWNPVFDKQAVASIGSIAVAPSNPNILYVGTGEGCLRGDISYSDGVYRSNDGGKTWQNLGLRDTRHIPKVLLDPRNPEVVLVAAPGHAVAPNAERGVFRSADGGIMPPAGLRREHSQSLVRHSR